MADVGRPLKFKNAKEIEKAAEKYFKECDENFKPYTMTGLAIALDTSRQTLINYSNKEEYFDTIKKVKDKVEQYAEEKLFTGSNTAGVIFNLKNNYGWVDRQEVDTKVNLSYEDKLKEVAGEDEY